MEELDLEEGPPGVDVPPPPDENDDADEGVGTVADGSVIPRGGSSGGGSLVGGSTGVGEPLANVDEDAPPQIEGVQAPRMSGSEKRGVHPLRLIEIMAAAADVEDGGDSEVKSIDLLTVSRSANSLVKNLVHHGRNKHIGWKWHFIRKQLEMGIVKLVNARTELMGADMMTKSVRPAVLGVNRKLIGITKCG